jgi:hypothetical protein
MSSRASLRLLAVRALRVNYAVLVQLVDGGVDDGLGAAELGEFAIPCFDLAQDRLVAIPDLIRDPASFCLSGWAPAFAGERVKGKGARSA